MPAISNLNVVLGRSFIPADDQYASRVAIVGYDIVDKLLPNVDPIGQEIRVDGEPYTVIGVGERQGKTLGQSQDNYVAVPITAYQHTYGTNRASSSMSRPARSGQRSIAPPTRPARFCARAATIPPVRKTASSSRPMKPSSASGRASAPHSFSSSSALRRFRSWSAASSS